MIGNGDVYKDGERIIDGTISDDDETSGEISTELNIVNVNTEVLFYYTYRVRYFWGRIPNSNQSDRSVFSLLIK